MKREISTRFRATRKASIVVLIGATVIGAWIGTFLLGGPNNNGAKADHEVTTVQAATAAGASISPTQPALRVEPK